MSVDISSRFVDWVLSVSPKRPLFVGVSGPQGSGKLYLAAHLVQELRQKRLKAVALLLDDFYWPYEQQQKVTRRARDENNLLLQGRGLPGTHDLALMEKVLAQMARGEHTSVPQYDKGAHGGVGDRAAWIPVPPVDVVVVEGWFCGFRSVGQGDFEAKWARASSIVRQHQRRHVEALNARLRDYERIWAYFDCFVYLHGDLQNVYRWRDEQEEVLRAQGRGMTPEEVRCFVDRYMPVYELYYEDMCRAAGARRLGLTIDAARQVRAVELDWPGAKEGEEPHTSM